MDTPKQKDLTGSLKKNLKREKDSQPLYKGSCTINGARFWISAWINEDRGTGEKYMALRFEPIVDKQGQQQPKPALKLDSNNSDDVPF